MHAFGGISIVFQLSTIVLHYIYIGCAFVLNVNYVVVLNYLTQISEIFWIYDYKHVL